MTFQEHLLAYCGAIKQEMDHPLADLPSIQYEPTNKGISFKSTELLRKITMVKPTKKKKEVQVQFRKWEFSET